MTDPMGDLTWADGYEDWIESREDTINGRSNENGTGDLDYQNGAPDSPF